MTESASDRSDDELDTPTEAIPIRSAPAWLRLIVLLCLVPLALMLMISIIAVAVLLVRQ